MIQQKAGKPPKSKMNTFRSAAPPAPASREGLSRPGKLSLSPQERFRMIAEAAYYRALRRGFKNGSPEQDWREAEAEIDAMLIGSRRT